MHLPRFALPLIFAAASGAGAFALTRAPGPGLDPDSMQYLGAAEALAQTGTLRVPASGWDDPDGTAPLSHFPPGFSLAIAASIGLGTSSLDGARIIEALAAATTAGVTVWLAGATAGPLAATLAGALLLVTPALALDHLVVLSEPLFLALFVVTLAGMVRAPDRPFAHGLGAMLASTVRYAGVAIGLAAALWALRRPGPLRRRLTAVAAAGVPTLVVQGGWLLRAHLESGSVRAFGVYRGLGGALWEGLGTLTGWLAPGTSRFGPRGAIAGPVVLLAVAILARASRREGTLLPATGIAAACYALVLAASRLFADAEIPFDERLLSPLFVLGGLALAVSIGLLAREAGPWMRTLGAVLLVTWLVASARQSLDGILDARDGGWGYADEEWTSSDVVRWLRSDGLRFALFTNSPADVWFATQRPSWVLPHSLDSGTLSAFGAVLRQRHGAVIGFAEAAEPTASPAEIALGLGLVEIARFDGTVVWASAPR